MVKFLGTHFFSLSHFFGNVLPRIHAWSYSNVCKTMDDNWIQIYASKKKILAKTMQRIYT